ncbi:MAG: hypothetical protein Nk1A_6680 [Endomicrobiia bacterium]|nr:MAG: hypothetical protein Nk1A_6680 [Endomicrobiia bacterium]
MQMQAVDSRAKNLDSADSDLCRKEFFFLHEKAVRATININNNITRVSSGADLNQVDLRRFLASGQLK